jgi:hypothetical protein
MSRRRIDPATTADKLRTKLEGTLRFIHRHNRGKDAARRRALETIDYLKRHLPELGVDRSLTRSLDDIHMAFAEAERGRIVSLFEPKQVGHKLPTELSRLYVMAKASLAMDLLMAAKVKKEKAAREVAKVLRKHGFPFKGNLDVPAWRTVVGWREKLRKKRASGADSYGKLIYRLESEAYQDLIKEGHLDPKARAELELEMVGQSLTNLG